MRTLAALAVLMLSAVSAHAGLSRAELDMVAAAPPQNARLDLGLAAPDADGKRRTLGEIIAGRPAFLIFVDYTCNTLCGTELALLGAALLRSRLDPASYRILVLGLDPKDPAEGAAAMVHREVPATVQTAARFLLPDQAVIGQATKALGFHYFYDAQRDQFAHPAVVYVLAPDGAVRTTLSPFDLTAVDLREVLDRHPAGSSGLYDRIRLLCYGYDPATGRYTGWVTLLLRVGAIVAVMLVATSVLLLARLGKQRR